MPVGYRSDRGRGNFCDGIYDDGDTEDVSNRILSKKNMHKKMQRI